MTGGCTPSAPGPNGTAFRVAQRNLCREHGSSERLSCEDGFVGRAGCNRDERRNDSNMHVAVNTFRRYSAPNVTLADEQVRSGVAHLAAAVRLAIRGAIERARPGYAI